MGLRGRPAEGVMFDGFRNEHYIVLVLDPDQAEGIAGALGSGDAASAELLEWAEECKRLDAESRLD